MSLSTVRNLGAQKLVRDFLSARRGEAPPADVMGHMQDAGLAFTFARAVLATMRQQGMISNKRESDLSHKLVLNKNAKALGGL